MDINESVLIAEFIQQDQGLPISLVPNKPFNLTLADLLWIDPDTDPAPATPFKKSLSLPNSTLISSPIRHKDDTSSSTSLSSPHAESFSISFFLSEESYQTFSSLPPFVPSIPLEMECPVASLPTSNKPIKTTEDEKTPLPSFVKENPIETKTGPSGKRESSTSSSSLPAFSNSFRPTPNLPTATITPLADPRLLNRTTSVLMKTSHPPLECPSPPTSSNDSSPTLNTPNPSKPITLPENNPSLHSLSSHKHPTTNANPNITPAPSRSSIDQLYSLYHGKTSESDRNHFPQFYTKLMRTEHELYLRLEEKKTCPFFSSWMVS
ncbi:hypothetical protein HMI56_005757 [Coelomomyces lativittatus]|nr:hypothetical protein HMI56_005757 [Coelomomyces lativittatus]